MQSSEVKINDTITVRLYEYKSRRHYGGREITTTTHLVKAKLSFIQDSSQPYVVELLEKFGAFKIGHKIAIMGKDFNL